jgi:hypothetical protein
MIWSRSLGRTVYRVVNPDQHHGKEMEMGNAFAWCPYPKCKFAQFVGTSIINHIHKHHESKSVPAIGIWDVICEHIRHNQDSTVADIMGQKNGSMCSKCGHYSQIPCGIMDHTQHKHPHDKAESWICKLQPAVRDGEGEGDNRSLQ